MLNDLISATIHSQKLTDLTYAFSPRFTFAKYFEKNFELRTSSSPSFKCTAQRLNGHEKS